MPKATHYLIFDYYEYIIIIRVIVSRTVAWLEGTKVIANFSRYKTVSGPKKLK